MKCPARLLKAALLSVAALGAPALAGTEARSTIPRPTLIVALSVDQLSADLFDQYRSHFTQGLGRLANEGVVFHSGYQSHAITATCPGHSTLLTGRHPSGTGIISNDWWSASDGRGVYCAADDSVVVPGRRQGMGPGHLRVSTLGEWLRAADPDSRTVAVAGKDRSAIMMAGHDPYAVYWWDNERGFNTHGRTLEDAGRNLQPVRAFNEELAARWDKAVPQWEVLDRSCSALAGGRQRHGDLIVQHTLPPAPFTPTPGRPLRTDAAFQAWMAASPILDAITVEVAIRLVDRFQLGARDATDVLAIGLSSTDKVGHRYTNQGPEMCDHLAHLDHEIAGFLAALDARKIPYLVALSADHGAIDAAESLSERGFDAHREPDGPTFVARLNKAVMQVLPALTFKPLLGDLLQLYVSPKATPQQKAAIIEATRAALQENPAVLAVHTRQEALAAMPPRGTPVDETSVLERWAEGVDAERSGDLLLTWKPYASFGNPRKTGDTVAGHGSPWDYDRRVPILFWWPGATGFEQPLPVETVDIAPTLAPIAGITPPVPVDGRCLDLDITAASSCGIRK